MNETIDATELPQDEKQELAMRMLTDDEGSIEHLERLKRAAVDGTIDETPRTITTEYHGESLADALGRVYKIRDTIENHCDISVSCEPTGVEYTFPSTTFYQVHIHLNGGE